MAELFVWTLLREGNGSKLFGDNAEDHGSELIRSSWI